MVLGTLSVPAITFDARNDASIDDVEISDGMTFPDEPTWDNYTFDGWWTGIDGTGDEITVTDATSLTKNTTLYAKWTNNSKTVRTKPLNLNSNTDDTATTSEGWSWNNTTSTLTLTDFTCDITHMQNHIVIVKTKQK